MRSYMRDINLGREPREEIAEAVGMTGEQVYEMYKLLAIAKYDDRYVIPTSSPETPRGIASLDPFGDNDPANALLDLEDAGLGMGAPEACSSGCGTGSGSGSTQPVSLTSWTGDRPDSMFPPRKN